ncbi:hypothetical protein L7P61_21760 [Aeromonas veronii bv. sobria]|uniref:hypothetical protein n=1 Tax=Aeromonas veronii TaxID=654 RepID=UPI003CE5BE65
MKDATDQGTGDMFGIKRGRGRPKTGLAKSGAERQAAYRAKQQEINVTVTLNRHDLKALKLLLSFAKVKGVAELGLAEALERIERVIYEIPTND